MEMMPNYGLIAPCHFVFCQGRDDVRDTYVTSDNINRNCRYQIFYVLLQFFLDLTMT